MAGAMKSKELFPAIFSRHAAEYRSRIDEVMARGRMRLIALAAAGPGMRVLDMACGPGNLKAKHPGASETIGRNQVLLAEV